MKLLYELSNDDLIMGKHEVMGELIKLKGNERIFFTHQEKMKYYELTFKLKLINEALEERNILT